LYTLFPIGFLEAISKVHLAADAGVARLSKMLTACSGCCAFPRRGLALDGDLLFLRWFLVGPV
jgi:hypothetical protein